MLPLSNSALVARLGALALLLASPAAAQTDAIAADFAGNRADGEFLAQEFTVGNGPIRITRFAAFDDGKNGFRRDITVKLYDAATQAVVGPTITFTNTTVGTHVGSFLFVDLLQPIDLPQGFVGRIGASGYGDGERYYNAFNNDNRFVTLNPGGALTFGRVYYDADGTDFPDTPSGDVQSGWYGTASFTFGAAVTTTPEPATWATLGAGLLALGAAARRRRAA
jgi:hypothetical protein